MKKTNNSTNNHFNVEDILFCLENISEEATYLHGGYLFGSLHLYIIRKRNGKTDHTHEHAEFRIKF